MLNRPLPILCALMMPMLTACAGQHESPELLQRRVRAAEDALMRAAARASSGANPSQIAMLQAIERPDKAPAWTATPPPERRLMLDIAYRVAAAESGYNALFFGHGRLSPVNRGGMAAYDPIAILQAAEGSADRAAAEDPAAKDELSQLGVDFRRILLSDR